MQQTKQPKFSEQLTRLTAGRTPWFWGAILVLPVIIVYWPTLNSGFVYDDKDYVQNNLSIRSLPGLANSWFKLDTFAQYQPLTFTAFFVEYHLWGLNPRGYHVVNWFLHATAALLVWRLLVRLAVPGAWLAAAIFAVHPVHVESVAWVCELKNLLSCILALGSILAYLRFSPPEAADSLDATSSAAGNHWRSYALALGLYTAALVSKNIVVSVPAVLLVIYWWKRGRVTWRDATALTPFFAIGLAVSGITMWTESKLNGTDDETWNFSFVEHLLIAGRALWFYVGKLVWPHPLIFFYPRWVIDAHVWWQCLFPLGVLAVLVGLWLARERISRGPLAAVLIFCGVLVPALGFFYAIGFLNSFVFDHFQYHASIALIAMAAAALALAGRRLASQVQWVAHLTVIGVLLLLAVVAQQKTHVYKNHRALDENIVALNPQSCVAHHNLGIWFQQLGKYDEAIPHHQRALEIQEKLARDNPTIGGYQSGVATFYVSLGLPERKLGRLAEAEGSFRKSIAIREKLVAGYPAVNIYRDDLAWSYVHLSLTQDQAGRPADAAASQREAIAIREKLAQDNPTESRYQNDVAASYVDLGDLQREMGQVAEAESSFRNAIAIRMKLSDNHPTATFYQEGLAWSYVHLGLTQHKSGRPADAAASQREAIAIREKLVRDDPTESRYQNDLAASYADLGDLQREMGQMAEAITSCQKAVAIREKLVLDQATIREYQASLGWSYANLGIAQLAGGRPADAVTSCQKAVEIREQLVHDHATGSDYQALGWGYANLGVAQLASGRPADAEVSHRKAIVIREKLVQDNPARADYQHELADSRLDLDNARRGAFSTP